MDEWQTVLLTAIVFYIAMLLRDLEKKLSKIVDHLGDINRKLNK